MGELQHWQPSEWRKDSCWQQISTCAEGRCCETWIGKCDVHRKAGFVRGAPWTATLGIRPKSNSAIYPGHVSLMEEVWGDMVILQHWDRERNFGETCKGGSGFMLLTLRIQRERAEVFSMKHIQTAVTQRRPRGCWSGVVREEGHALFP